jgi:hypothetical protein
MLMLRVGSYRFEQSQRNPQGRPAPAIDGSEEKSGGIRDHEHEGDSTLEIISVEQMISPPPNVRAIDPM